MFGKLGRCANKRTEVVRFNQPLTGGLLFLMFWYGTSGLKSWVSFPYLSILWCGGTDPCIGSGPWIHLLPASGVVAIANVRVRGSWRIRLLMRWDGIVLEKYYLCLNCCLGMASQESSPLSHVDATIEVRSNLTEPRLLSWQGKAYLDISWKLLPFSSSLWGNRILQRGKEMKKELVLKKVSLRADLHKNLQPWRSQSQTRHGVGITANGLLIMGLMISFHLYHLILHEETRLLSSELDY
jgi:hypothetical protein